MANPLLTAISWTMSRLYTLLIFVLLGSIAIWGARHDWRIERLSSLWGEGQAEEDPATAGIRVISESPAGGSARSTEEESFLHTRLAFPSEEAAVQAGIRVVPARV